MATWHNQLQLLLKLMPSSQSLPSAYGRMQQWLHPFPHQHHFVQQKEHLEPSMLQPSRVAWQGMLRKGRAGLMERHHLLQMLPVRL
jgi:hypothetical protein